MKSPVDLFSVQVRFDGFPPNFVRNSLDLILFYLDSSCWTFPAYLCRVHFCASPRSMQTIWPTSKWSRRFPSSSLDRLVTQFMVRFTHCVASLSHVLGWVLPPINFDPSQSYPVVNLVHGGPQSNWYSLNLLFLPPLSESHLQGKQFFVQVESAALGFGGYAWENEVGAFD